MLSQITIYKNLIIGGIVLVVALFVWSYIYSLNSQIAKLQSTLKDSYVELANEKLQSSRYQTALSEQSRHIKAIELNEKLANTKLRKWKKQTPLVRYKTIIKIREVHSDDCKQIKNTINSIRSIDFNKL